jgi:shikimate 5-dehydrogenase/shikimate kinase
MITAVIGHRGTGKTELMKRLKYYLGEQAVDFVDLDEEIEKKIGKTIWQLFIDHGEAYFRDLERQIFVETLQRKSESMYLILGAGFDVTVIPDHVQVLWVQRSTDLDGRIFLDRPRLNPDVSPVVEFQKRSSMRQASYAAAADEVYLMPEGVFENKRHAMAIEKSILNHTVSDVGGGLTIMPEVFEKEKRWGGFKSRWTNKGLQFFEMRDDLLSKEQMKQAQQEMPDERFMISFRKSDQDHAAIFADPEWQALLARAAWIDWAFELGVPTIAVENLPKEKLILSSHKWDSFQEFVTHERSVAHLKFAPEVQNYSELHKGDLWMAAKPEARSFLPRSVNGRWTWYRLLQKNKMLVNFLREGAGSALDQPSLFEWLSTPRSPAKFAAVLGDPVRHSFTPLEQGEYFAKKDLPVFAINIQRDEWNEAFPILQKQGLRYAAVTAPHKEAAAKISEHESMQAVNTLFWSEKTKTWKATSTDEMGFNELIEGAGMIAPLQKEIFVWGGGGVLEVVKKCLPHASYFSSRTGKPREGSQGAESMLPKILVWAAPRAEETLMPPSEWMPAMIYDLNYKEDSMGREYAQKISANYQSGLAMFIAQAQGQRAFWNRCEDQE